MSVSSFLFGGTPPPNINTTTSDTSQLPAWYQEYLQGLMGTANTIAAQPFPQYTGPRLADFNPTQNTAFSNTANLPNVAAGNMSAANGALSSAGNTNIPGAVNSYLSASTSATNNPVNALSPYNATASNYLNTAAGYNPASASAPYLGAAAGLYGASAGINPSAAAAPYMGQASNYMGAAANTATPQGIQSYMSPYIGNVVQGLTNQANMNWTNNIMPGVNNQFIGAGQYASGRNAQVLGQAANDFQTNLSANVANALETGYGMAGTQAGTQAGVLGNLGATSLGQANTAGGLAGQQASILQGAGSGTAGLGSTAGTMAGNTAGIFGALGNTALAQGTAAGAAAGQEAGLQQSAGAIAGNAAQQQGALQTQVGAAQGALGQTAQNMALQSDAALQAVGNQQQGQTQSNLDLAYQDFQNQALWPQTQANFMSQIIRGLPTPGQTTTVNANQPASPFTQFSPSLASTILGIGNAAGASNTTPLFAKGGRVQHLAVGGPPQPAPPQPSQPAPGGDKAQALPNGDLYIPGKALSKMLHRLQADPRGQGTLAFFQHILQSVGSNGIRKTPDGGIIVPKALLMQMIGKIQQGRTQLAQHRAQPQPGGALSRGAPPMAPPAQMPPPQPQRPPMGALSGGM